MDGRRPVNTGAQNPAYRPTRPPPIALSCGSAIPAIVRGTFGAHGLDTERTVEGVTGPAAGLGDQVAVQVHGGSDRAVAEPAGHLGDWHALPEAVLSNEVTTGFASA
jgi:hypothetical protein